METCWMNRVVLVMKEGKGDVEFELATASNRSLTAMMAVRSICFPFFCPPFPGTEGL